MPKQENRPPLTEPEKKCHEALLKLTRKYGSVKPPNAAVAELIGLSTPRANALIQLVEAKGYAKETWEVYP
jgi:hypothetical protein